MDLQLNDKIIIVTGASKGIGLATARRFAAEGARVVAVSRNPNSELAELGPRVQHVAVDLASADGPAELVEAVVREHGRIDAVINNAGGPPPGTRMPVFGFLGRTDRDWQSMIDFNLLSVVRLCRAAIPVMIDNGGGAIVNVSSTHAVVPSAVNVDYGAAKAALRNLTQALAEEFGPQGIRVNTVTPGPVLTPWWTDPGGAADVLAEQTGKTRDAVITELAPELMSLTTGRLAHPEEIADAIALLASPRSGSTIGAELVIDGGLVKTV
ncbi:SDR family NAD(P)-dependent oxidoreductase [Microlunatus parietis]|uniref:NAD(P)-dependent dehydrogenase (Short-subunit alcohol dehydrogenase family) n=1 Tax=Microlunatus parietis TaxID=682979 RepID=A0A7Y9I5T7_9ACTN|nr:SDR family NAD(P)-dependent oxidoreductase [Microlunatus parietis]NYE70643.1 NAD(P)-dependent dehydrogenase (short-subunit alcohol dehydrogenase family) [Microlunatus parietis]